MKTSIKSIENHKYHSYATATHTECATYVATMDFGQACRAPAPLSVCACVRMATSKPCPR